MPTRIQTVKALHELSRHLPETISLEDIQHHAWLRDLVLVADRISNAVEYRALDWAKTRGLSSNL